MGNVARDFDQLTHQGVVRSLPYNDEGVDKENSAWEALPIGGMPPLMFQVRFSDGSFNAYAFSDLREVHCPHAGAINLHLFAMAKLVIRIEGRHLLELARGFSCAGIRWIQESDPRNTDNQYELHWSETAKQICGGLCGHVATHVNYEGRRDLVTVWQLASELATPDPQNPQRYWLENEMLANDAAGGMIRAAARQFYDRTGGEFSSVLSNLRKHLDWISYECMQNSLRGDSIDLRDLKRKFFTLYVTLPAMRMDALRGWMRLLVQMALVACEEERTLVGNQCVFQLDEFFALGRLSAVEVAIAQVAGLGAKLHIALQNLSQLSHYEKNYETFIANAGLVQVFGCGDDTTLEYVSKRLGQSLTLTRSTNAPTFEQAAKQAATGESWSLANHPLMTAEEIGRFFARDDKRLRQLILRPGYRPMILQRAFYDKHELFRGKYDEE